MTADRSIPIVMVAGLSGAGKSTALNAFEDLGFSCMDGLPVSTVPRLVKVCLEQEGLLGEGLVLGMNIREEQFLKHWRQALEVLSELKIPGEEGDRKLDVQTVFIEADLAELMRRYATTRRPHPLESERHGLRAALELEKSILEPVRNRAELVLDTTHYSIHDLRRVLQEKWSTLRESTGGLKVHVISFGFKYGAPKEADLLFDLRFLPNPHFEPELRPLTGRNHLISDYVLGGEPGATFRKRLVEFLHYMVPLYAEEGRYRLTVAVGCTGGRHRSVAVAEMVFKSLKEQGLPVSLEHRHIERG